MAESWPTDAPERKPLPEQGFSWWYRRDLNPKAVPMAVWGLRDEAPFFGHHGPFSIRLDRLRLSSSVGKVWAGGRATNRVPLVEQGHSSRIAHRLAEGQLIDEADLVDLPSPAKHVLERRRCTQVKLARPVFGLQRDERSA